MRGCYRAGMGDHTFRSVGRARARFVASVLLAAATLLAATACQPATSGGLPLLTAPGDIVMAGVESTAALHSVHARLDMKIKVAGGPDMGGQQFESRSLVDVDLDLETRALAARTLNAGEGAPDQTTEVIVVNGRQFTRTLPATRWMQFPNFGAQQPFPSNEELVTAISSIVKGPGPVFELADSVSCGEATCYHVIVQLDAASAWQLFAPVVMGGAANGPPPEGFEIPPVTLHVYVDQPTRKLIAVSTVISFMGTGVSLDVGLSNHDVPVQIVPPPAAQVDQLDANFGGGGILAPMPAEAPTQAP